MRSCLADKPLPGLQICHSMMDQLFHGTDPPASEAAAADALCQLWSKYSSFPTDNNFNPHLR